MAIICTLFVFSQIARLEKLLTDKESGLGSATSQITSLREAADRLKQELNSTKNELTISKNKASSIDVSCNLYLKMLNIYLSTQK